jgi:hypothetical protein
MQWVYSGRTGKIVSDEEAEELYKQGWKDHPHDVLKSEPRLADSDEVAALKASAELLGIEVDGRWGITRLRKEVERARNRAATDNESVSPT